MMAELSKNIKILIVDDQQVQRMILIKILAKIDAKTFQAENSEQAIQLINQHEFSLMLLDLEMPDKNGFELLEILQDLHLKKSLPVMFLLKV